MEWNRGPYYSFAIKSIFQYFAILSVSFHDINSLFGFFTFLVVASQLVSGTMLAFSLIPEPMIVPIVREEEDTEDLYIDDFFWLHERGVDLVFTFSYLHLFRKLYLNVFEYENESAWKSGVFTFLIFQVVVFAGLVLCCTHLSEITLTIAANILHTFFMFKGKFYWWIFTDKQLNTDTMVRLAYLHYLSAFYMAYLGLVHGVDMHYDWKNETSFDGLDTEMVWWDEALSNELSHVLDAFVILTVVWWFMFTEPEALTYEIFMWGDIGIVTDVRFYGVAPHWYFRPYMAWLIACPHHKTGIFGLLFYFFILFYQPVLHGTSEFNNYNKRTLLFVKRKLNRNNFFAASYINLEMNLYHQITYGLFIGCCMYCTSFLPYGRFYNRLGGNVGMLGAYMYVFFYLGFPIFRRPVFLELFSYFLYLRVNFLKNLTIVKI
jgi:quinol-cytochrome oxidoreductase complex cytochrome b subunit